MTTLSGTARDAAGDPLTINGRIWFELSQDAVTLAGSCSGGGDPFQVGRAPVTFPLVDGAMSPGTIIGNDCLSPEGTYYNETIVAASGAVVVRRKVTITGATADIGALPAPGLPSGTGGPGTVTSVAAGAGLTGGTITEAGTIALSVPVTVARGGTGGVSAAAARTNLGVLAADGSVALTGSWLNTQTIRGVLQDRGGQVFDVHAYGATGNGSTNDYAAIAAAIAAAGEGGIVFFPPGTYCIESTVTIGDGTSLAVSTVNGIALMGSGIGTTIIKWTGSSGGVMLDVVGPIEGIRVENMTLECNVGLADTALRTKGLQKSMIRNVAIRGNKAFAVIQDAYNNPPSFTTANQNIWENVFVNSTQTNAGGWRIGPTTSAPGDVAQNVYVNCHARFDGAASGTVGVELRFCDYLTFHNPLFAAHQPVKISPQSGVTQYPQAVTMYAPVLYSLASGDEITVNGSYSAAVGTGLHLVSYHTADGEEIPPYSQDFAWGETFHGVCFGRRRRHPLFYSAINSSTEIASTDAETAFSKSYALPAGVLNYAGAIIRVRAKGIVTVNGTPDFTLAARIGGGSNRIGATSWSAVAGLSANTWSLDYSGVVLTTGASGTVGRGVGFAQVATLYNGTGGSAVAATLDLTSALTVEVTVQFSAAHSNNKATLNALSVEIVFPDSTS